jgi:hypothetical protein
MNLDHLIAAAGLLALAGGMLVVNLVPAPRTAQAGTVMATCGLGFLTWLAIRQLLS